MLTHCPLCPGADGRKVNVLPVEETVRVLGVDGASTLVAFEFDSSSFPPSPPKSLAARKISVSCVASAWVSLFAELSFCVVFVLVFIR